MRTDIITSLLALLTSIGRDLGLVQARPTPAPVPPRIHRFQIADEPRYRRVGGTDLGSGGCIEYSRPERTRSRRVLGER